ncbi:hypothetical protein [Limnohabitans sp.]|uniref:hypothetical protein n=1 Tax=Limnohabitans sp. TaxID=1907725 RepID=UPI00311E4033
MQPRLEQLGLTALATVAYFLTFKLNQYLDPWFLYGQGISLLFLPAGVKHVSILLAGRWGALGSFLGLLVMVPAFWPELSIEMAIPYVAISTLSTWAGIVLSMRLMGIRRDLSNLKLLQLPLLDLVTILLHAVTTNTYFVLAGLKKINDWNMNTLAMMVGDYLGSLSLMLLLFIVLQWLPRRSVGAP